MSHLRDDVSALVDGQLPPERAEAAMVHLVTCDYCAGLVAVERASRRHLSQAQDVRPSEDLTARLMQLAQSPAPAAPQGARALVGRAWEPLTYGRGRRRAVLRTSAVLAGAAGVLGVLVVVGTLNQRTGDPTAMLAEVAGPAHKPVQLMVSADTMRLAEAPSATEEALVWLRENGWAAPSALPAGANVQHVGATGAAGEQVLTVEIARDGHHATVVEERGVLEPTDLATLPAVDVGDHSVHQLPGPGTTVVLQCDGTTVLITSPDAPDLVHEIAAAFPATTPGSGVADRIDHGWQTLVGWTDLLVQTR
jgi:hypothetical protein